METRKINPCPFCHQSHPEELRIGKEELPVVGDIYATVYFAACSCGAQGPHGETPEEALERWNRLSELREPKPTIPVLSFRIVGNPPHITHQAGTRNVAQFGHVVRYKTREYVRQEKNTVAIVLSKLPRDWKPLDGPVELRLKLVEAYRKSEPKRNTRNGAELPRDTKPDLDNLAKGYIDALTMAGVWRDDSQIARQVLEKAWGPLPYWEISVAKMLPAAPAADTGDGQLKFDMEGGR